MIPCAEKCEFQKEGLCTLNGKSKITNVKKGCPYYTERKTSYDISDSFLDGFNINKFDSVRKRGAH